MQTVTDADGDAPGGDRPGTGVFQIEDDGPDAVVADATADGGSAGETAPGWDGDESATATGWSQTR